MTNFEKIKAMTADEMAEWIKTMVDNNENHNVGCYQCMHYGTHHTNKKYIGTKNQHLYYCKDCEHENIGLNIDKWLKSEVTK